nr:MAG TPA: hypothetical protein [Caudoviricetes sp.]
MATTRVYAKAAYSVKPLVDHYFAQETHYGKTVDGRDTAVQLYLNILMIEAIKIKYNQTIKETKLNLRGYFGNIINEAYCDEIAERLYLAVKAYMEE